jgi:type IV pilus assembly protein PilE
MPIRSEGKPHNLGDYWRDISAMSLVELMVVVVIIGILATLIFPSFKQQIIQSRRGDGISQLLQLKIQQESFRIENTSYASTEQLTLPSSDYYIFSVSGETATTYSISATAKGSQLEDTNCEVLTLDQSMNKTPVDCFF